ncbi:MAG: hypothetical protein IT445_08520 [Phycisphaeraceae bacterium]|nr:hypothetical protein [Phycisphaeraceae bacterium]
MSKPVEKIKSKRGRRIRAALLLTLTALIWIALWSWHLYRSEPTGWQQALEQAQQVTSEQSDQVAQDLENRMAAQLSFADRYDEHGRPLANHSPQRTIHIPADQINLWIRQRLPRWLANRKITLPPQLGRICFWTDGERMVLGAFVNDERLERVVSVAMYVEVDPQANDAVLRLDGAWIGRLRVPLSVCLDMLRAQLEAGGQTEAAQAVRQLAEGYHFPPVLDIGGEISRCTAIRAVDDGLEIDLRQD